MNGEKDSLSLTYLSLFPSRCHRSGAVVVVAAAVAVIVVAAAPRDAVTIFEKMGNSAVVVGPNSFQFNNC